MDKEFLRKGPPGVEEVRITRTQVFPELTLWGADQAKQESKSVYNRQGNLLHTDSKYNSYEYDYDDQGSMRECRAFRDSRLDFKIEFQYCGKRLSSCHRTEYDLNDGRVIDYMGEDWQCDDRGRIVSGQIYYGNDIREVTYRYAERATDQEGQFGEGKVTDIFYERVDFLERTRKFLGGTVFFYGKDNQLEEIRQYCDKSVIEIDTLNRQGDVVELKHYNFDGEFVWREKFTYKYENKNGRELKVEQIEEHFKDYENTDGEKEKPDLVIKQTYEYEFYK
mgnify:CR=1 FL=1